MGRIGRIGLSVFAAGVLLVATALSVDAKKPKAPEKSWVVEGLTEQSVRASLPSEGSAESIEGLWRMAPGGALVALVPGTPLGGERTLAQGWLMVVLDSPRAVIAPGTVMGWAERAATPGTLRGWMFTGHRADTLTTPRDFRLQLSGPNHLQMTEIKSGLKFTPWRVLPFLYRRGLSEHSLKDEGLTGLIRVYPLAGPPVSPRRL